MRGLILGGSLHSFLFPLKIRREKFVDSYSAAKMAASTVYEMNNCCDDHL